MIKDIKISALNRTEYEKNDACWGKQIIIASFHTLNFIAIIEIKFFCSLFVREVCKDDRFALH